VTFRFNSCECVARTTIVHAHTALSSAAYYVEAGYKGQGRAIRSGEVHHRVLYHNAQYDNLAYTADAEADRCLARAPFRGTHFKAVFR
jgi:hypothetical protein